MTTNGKPCSKCAAAMNNNIAGTKKRRKSKKRKISGIESIPYELILGATGGSYAAVYLDKMVADSVAKDPESSLKFMDENPMIRDGIKVVGGAFLAAMDNKWAQGLGIGIVTNGALGLIKEFTCEKDPTTKKCKTSGIYGNNGAFPPVQQLGTGPNMIGNPALNQAFDNNYEGLGTGNTNIAGGIGSVEMNF